jgi:uncharacterized membrane protein
MEELIPILILLAVICLLSGPLALVVSLIALGRVMRMQRQQPGPAEQRASDWLPARAPTAEPKPPAPAEPPAEGMAKPPPQVPTTAQTVESAPRQREAAAPQAVGSLEQRIGTRWVLVAGVVTVIFAVGFFLKYAYENEWIGPLGRVIVASVAGLVSLVVGEGTRRRGYDVAAKGVTALGFAILYATIFAAHRWYDLIGSAPAYVLAIAVTVAAMSYAVALNEIIAALLALVGGYLTPVLLSTGRNLPTPLFCYVLILSAGAMLCAYWRRWGAVNILAFIGTFALYTAWFEKFYRPVMQEQSPPEQLGAALFWLAVFFLVFLFLPLLHTLARRAKSRTRDMILVLANAAVAFYYLWTIIDGQFGPALALCSLGMGGTYLALMALVIVRCREDTDLRHALLATGLVFVALAVPLHFEMYAVAVVWAAQAVALAVVGLRYRSILAQLVAGAALALAIGKLTWHLPLHREPFQVVLNTAFGAWFFVAAATLACHALYRFSTRADKVVRQIAAEVLYAFGLLLLMVAVGMELWHHGDLNVAKGAGMAFFTEQMMLVFALFLLVFVIRPLPPAGGVCPLLAMVIAAAGSVFLAFAYPQFHRVRFALFANLDFIKALAFAAALFAAAWLEKREEFWQRQRPWLSLGLGVAAIVTLWLLLTEEIWFYFRFRQPDADWRVVAHMAVSVSWALYALGLMVVGFWRKLELLRYLALGLFLLLLAKIFLVDTRTVATIYRIAGFLATGLALVGVAYLYQSLKKQGFFETMGADASTDAGDRGGDA